MGVTLIDTAPAYGFGRWESIVGDALSRDSLRDKVCIATKAGLAWKDGRVFRDSRPGSGRARHRTQAHRQARHESPYGDEQRQPCGRHGCDGRAGECRSHHAGRSQCDGDHPRMPAAAHRREPGSDRAERHEGSGPDVPGRPADGEGQGYTDGHTRRARQVQRIPAKRAEPRRAADRGRRNLRAHGLARGGAAALPSSMNNTSTPANTIATTNTLPARSKIPRAGALPPASAFSATGWRAPGRSPRRHAR